MNTFVFDSRLRGYVSTSRACQSRAALAHQMARATQSREHFDCGYLAYKSEVLSLNLNLGR